MPRENTSLQAFNRGLISPLALARTDLTRTQLSAEIQTNYMPRVLGSMMLRPGLKYLSSTYLSNPAKQIPFVFSTADKALIEVTDGFLRVRVDDAIITRNAVSTVTRGGTFDSDITNFNSLSTTAGGATVQGCAFHPNGDLVAYTTLTAGDKLKLYSISGTTLTALSTQPASIPATDINDVAFSPDGRWLAVSHTASPYVSIWAVTGSGASATFVKQSNPATLPTAQANDVAFSSDSQYMAVAYAASPFIVVYAISGSTFTALAAPTAAAGNGNGVCFSFDGTYVSLAHDTTPYITNYSFNGSGSSATLSKSTPTAPAGNGQSVSWSRNGLFMAVAHTTTPFITVYSVAAGVFTKLSNPATLPDGNATSCHFTSDNQYLAVGHATSQFMTLYDFQTGAPVKANDPGTIPGTTVADVRFSDDNHFLAVADGTNMRLYEAYQWLDRDDTGTTSSYTAGTTVVTSGPTTTGNNALVIDNHTVRQVIDASAISTSGNLVSVEFACDTSGTFAIDKAYIGHAATSGDAYDFATTPTQLTFSGGAAGFSITGSATITSDYATFALDATKNLVISYHLVTGDNAGVQTTFAGYSSYYTTAAGDDASTVDATVAYTNYTGTKNVLGIKQVNVITSGASTGTLSMVGTNYLAARRTQTISVIPADVSVEHAVRVVVSRGEVTFKIGTSYGTDDIFSATILKEGTHSLTFTPGVKLIFLEVSSTTKYTTLLDTITIESSGDMTLVAPWTTANLYDLRWVQSGDIIYVACKNKQQYKIERRSTTSWSVVKYLPEDGPFRTENTSSLITVAPSATTGDVTLTASQSLFKTTNVGGLFRISSSGQYVSANITGANQFTNSIKVFGTGTSRNIVIARTGTFSGTITVQRSFGEPGAWVDTGTTYTTAGTVTVNDGFDNQIVYYRIGIKTGDYTSGSVVTELTYSSGSLDGIARITGYSSPTSVTASVIVPFGGTTASEVWAEGLWSDRRGWPTAVTIFEGRMWWAGKDRIVGSVSDAYESFAETLDTGDVGDSNAINRSIGFGPVDTINWLLPIQNLMLGGQSAEISAKSNSFDEPITPSKFQIMPVSTQGSAAIPAMMVDNTGLFVQRSGSRVFELAYDSTNYSYGTKDLTALIPEVGMPYFITADVQRQPDTRIHFVRRDGTVAVLVFDSAEEVRCWIEVETDGLVEDVAVLPGSPGNLEDEVYYVVNRTINGSTVRYLEKWALESECIGGLLNKQADSFIIYDSTPTGTVTGLSHLEGKTVVIWGDGVYVGTAVVGSGSVSLSGGAITTASKIVVGLPYTAQYKSTKLAYAAQGGTALNMTKRVPQIAFIMQNTHRFGVKFGEDFDHLDDLPAEEEGEILSNNKIWETYDQPVIPFNSDWTTDTRICLQSVAPKPVTILAVTITVETNG